MISALFTDWPLVAELTRRDLKSRYVGSTLGVTWAVLQPLFLILIFTVVFSVLARAEFVGADFPGPGPQPRLHPMKDYAVLNLSVTGRIWPSFIEWKLAVKNALDTEYQSMFGYPMPGRHILLDMQYSF